VNRKVPSNAFEFYFSLGPSRSYQAVADRYGVTKQAITKVAARERWPERLAELEDQARQRSTEKAMETLDEMNERHLKILRAVQSKAIEGLRSMPVATARDILRALELVMRQERVIRGQPGERGELSLEEITRRELQTLLIVGEEEEEDGDASRPAQASPSPTAAEGLDPCA
jgi:hypothetical protein